MEINQPHIQKKAARIKHEPLLDTGTVQYRLEEKAFIENAVMMIPINTNLQVHIHVYNIEGKRHLDIREYSLRGHKKFMSTAKGLRIPIEYLEQLIIRLKALQGKPNEWELKL